MKVVLIGLGPQEPAATTPGPETATIQVSARTPFGGGGAVLLLSTKVMRFTPSQAESVAVLIPPSANWIGTLFDFRMPFQTLSMSFLRTACTKAGGGLLEANCDGNVRL